MFGHGIFHREVVECRCPVVKAELLVTVDFGIEIECLAVRPVTRTVGISPYAVAVHDFVTVDVKPVGRFRPDFEIVREGVVTIGIRCACLRSCRHSVSDAILPDAHYLVL